MSTFLTTKGISLYMQEIIKKAKKRLVLISPYIKIDQDLKEHLQDKAKANVDIHLVYGKKQPDSQEISWLESITLIKVSFRKNLHAKCYLNENDALVTSMNLYESSQNKNDEMGILVSRAEDSDLYDSISKEADRLVRLSNKRTANFKPLKNSEILQRTNTSSNETPKKAYCIRCKSSIQFNLRKPYCRDCSKEWNNIKKNKFNHTEKYCHSCGEEHEGINYNKPICRSCYFQNSAPQPLKTSTPP